jgi:hypothetical protein
MKTKRLYPTMIAGMIILSATSGSAYADTSSGNGENHTTSPVISQQSAANDAWSHSQYYNVAKEMVQSGVWDTVMQAAPKDPMTTSEFVSLLTKVTGTVQNKYLPQIPPNQVLTRTEAATWLKRFTHFNTGTNAKPTFSDVKDSTAGYESIHYVYDTGLMVGDGAAHFFPNEVLTREQSAIVMRHVLHDLLQVTTDQSYHMVDSDTGHAKETLQAFVDAHKEDTGLFVLNGDSGDSNRYVMVSCGEKPTTGYDIKLDQVKSSDNAIYVHTETSEPQPGSIQAMHVTYPYVLIRVQDLKKPIYWINDNTK